MIVDFSGDIRQKSFALERIVDSSEGFAASDGFTIVEGHAGAQEGKISLAAEMGVIHCESNFTKTLGQAFVGLDRPETSLAVTQFPRCFFGRAFGDDIDDAADRVRSKLARSPAAQDLDAFDPSQGDGRKIHRSALGGVEFDAVQIYRDLFGGGSADADGGELAQAAETLHEDTDLLREQFGQGSQLVAVIVRVNDGGEGRWFFRAFSFASGLNFDIAQIRGPFLGEARGAELQKSRALEKNQ